MDQHIIKLILLLCSLFFLPQAAQASLFGQNGGNQFVPVDQAFAFDFKQQDRQLTLNWQIRPGYYLYRQQIKLVPQQVTLGAFTLPEGLSHKDEFFGEVAIFKQQLNLSIPLKQAAYNASLSITYQGCAEAGFCYTPETRLIPLDAVTALPLAAQTEPASLPFSPLWALLIGIGIAFTPCVLPMYPLISGIILGYERPHNSGHILALAVVYVQGMALTYTLLGLVVAAAGLQFQAALQHPYVLIGLSVLFFTLALSMFGLYSLQLPSALQTRLANWSNTQCGGSLTGVFLMGALAGLICSPCTTAPLSAILLYIAQSGNMWAGGGTLYLYALGMGIPLVIVTLFGNRLLPRSGPWMQHVKEGFGFVILALPVFLMERVLGDVWGLRLWSILGLAFFGWAFTLSLKASRGWVQALQLLLLAATVITARPLQDWVFGADNMQKVHQAHLNFTHINSIKQLEVALQKAHGKPVMLDLYADWCVACKEFEKYTFSDAVVQAKLANVVLLQVNVTANNAEQAALLKRLRVIGLPTILFFNGTGQELANQRITGFMDAPTFNAHLQKNGAISTEPNGKKQNATQRYSMRIA